MPAERITMRKLREILRLISVGDVPIREIARRTGAAPSTIRATIERIVAANLSWPLPEGLSDSELEARLYKNAGKKRGHRRCVEPVAGTGRRFDALPIEGEKGDLPRGEDLDRSHSRSATRSR